MFQTLFAPWRNDVQSAANIALSDRVTLWQQNLASRVFGFLIRFLVIATAAALLALVAAVLLGYLLLWLILPLIIVLLPFAAVLVITQ